MINEFKKAAFLTPHAKTNTSLDETEKGMGSQAKVKGRWKLGALEEG